MYCKVFGRTVLRTALSKQQVMKYSIASRRSRFGRKLVEKAEAAAPPGPAKPVVEAVKTVEKVEHVKNDVDLQKSAESKAHKLKELSEKSEKIAGKVKKAKNAAIDKDAKASRGSKDHHNNHHSHREREKDKSGKKTAKGNGNQKKAKQSTHSKQPKDVKETEPAAPPPPPPPPPPKKSAPVPEAIAKPKVKLDIPTFLSVSNLATVLKVRVPALLKKMEELGFEDMTNDYILDGETAGLIAQEYGYEINQDDNLGADLFPSADPKDTSKLKPRSPIVTIMGHVDHGKTTVLDFLRKSSIAAGEQGGITQHIGAFVVQTPTSKKPITFLDTPGHAAFLSMRERGANLTDVVILVVAADDSVMPQTIEAIKHTKNAGVPMIVAINKCDREEANPDKVVADLSRHGVDVEDYGGEVPVVRISAKKGTGMQDLEETIATVAELLELKGEVRNVPVEGWIIESQVKKGLGNVATFLVKKGQLKPGTFLVAGTTWCKVRSMKDERGKSVKLAGPSIPVEISGWKELPEAGDFAIQAKSEAFAKKVINNRVRRKQLMEEAAQVEDMNAKRTKEAKEAVREEKIQEYQMDGFTLDEIKELDPDLFEDEKDLKKEINYIVKADVSGSSEAVRQSIEGLGNDEVTSVVIYDEVGPPTESDVERAKSSGSQILVFNTKIPKDIANMASLDGVVIKEFDVIYHLIEDVISTLTEALPPKYETKVVSKAVVKKLFDITVKGKDTMTIAGSRIVDGVFKKNADVRLMRKGKQVYKGHIKQLKHEKDEVSEVGNGRDCGIALQGDPEMKQDDIIETLEFIPIKRHL